ncbi:MAG TPA: acyl-CoA dehydrogenase family protein [Stellaceae bacterium]|nr:acyl-CoA dehydrogenase family protein [Stellaceae bacterium]
MTDRLVDAAADRLFAGQVTPPLHAAAEAGTFPEALWRAVAEAGFAEALAAGAGLAGLPEAVAILRAAGRRAAPLPLAEAMLARWSLGAAGTDLPPQAVLTLAPVEIDERVAAERLANGWRLRGALSFVPWARAATHLVLVAAGGLFLLPAAGLAPRHDRNLAGEPRDHLALDAVAERLSLAAGRDPALLYPLGALCRAAQMAGALEGALALATQYANDRVQFGRPIGKLQAIQQQLAQMAEEAAAAGVAVDAAAAHIAAGGDAAFAAAIAKIRAGEAAGKAAEIAHQVHGAIGFTHEHPLHRLTRRLWSWRDEFGNEGFWALALGRRMAAQGAEAFWPAMTA